MASLENHLSDASVRDNATLIAVLNVDSFAQINDSLGAIKADRLLSAVGGRLRGILPQGDVVARLDGDEFAILSASDYPSHVHHEIADRLMGCFDDRFAIGRRTIAVSASVGYVVVNDYEDPEEVVRSARWAMREAKRAGKNRVRSVDDTFESETRELVELEDDLREAIGSGAIDVAFQPIANADGVVVAYETLARWERRTGERVAPNKFFAVAERIGLSSRLGEQILRKACKTLARWQDEFGEDDLSISVNFTADEIVADDFAGMVADAISSAGIEPRQLIVEVSDAATAQVFERLITPLESLRRLGVSVALDDFGAGFYTLNNLDRMPVNMVKIDSGFVNSALADDQGRMLFEYLVHIARQSSDLTVAEGVESEEQRVFVFDSGIDLVQGYHVAAPMSAAAAESRLDLKPPVPPSPERLASEFAGFEEAERESPLFSEAIVR